MMCQIQIKILKQNVIPNSSLPPNLKIYSLKDAEKLFKYDQRTVTNTAIPKLRIFSKRYHFRLCCFALTSEQFTADNEEYCPEFYKVNEAKTFKNVAVSFYASWSITVCTYIVDWLIQLVPLKIMLIQCCMLSDLTCRYQIICIKGRIHCAIFLSGDSGNIVSGSFHEI